MSGSKASDNDQHRPTSPTKTRQQNNILQESSAIPFNSPASPIAKHYPNEIPGSSNDSSEPYLLSSVSEEDLQHGQNRLIEERGGGGGGPSSSTLPQDHHIPNNNHSTAISSSTSFEETSPLHMEFEVKPSTSSEENKFHSNNNFNNSNNSSLNRDTALTPQQNVAAAPAANNNFQKKELTCVTDVLIPTIPSIHTSGSFSPLASCSVTSMDTMTPTGNRFQVPKFYDSEEEGVEGSLVLVPSTSKSLTSPRMVVSSSSVGGGGGGNGGQSSSQTPPQPPLPKDHRHGLTTTPAHLLPYQQRKKLIVEQQHPTTNGTTSATAADKRPPVPPSFAKLPSFPMTSELPPPVPSGAELAKKYGGVAEIPPFKGGGGMSSGQQRELLGNSSGGDGGGAAAAVDQDENVVEDVIMTPMKKSKSADASNKVIPSINRSHVKNTNNNAAAAAAIDDNKRETKIDNDTSTKEALRPPPPPPAFHEVISPPQPPSPSMRSGSPGEGSYHIRVSSCGSISSLGSMAVDSDSIRHASRRDHPNQHGFQQQQQVQLQQQQQHYHQMPPPPPPNHYYGGYPQPQQPLPPMRGGNPPNGGGGGGFVDLSQDIAMYLHGEQIANGEVAAAAAAHHGEYPPHNYWNHDDAPVYGYYPQSPLVEPTPPPLTQVPNMQMGHRSRLPSISDDDWSEDIEKYKADMEDGNRGGAVQRPYPVPSHRNYNNYGSRDRMAYPHQLPPPAQNRQRDQRKRMENYSQHQQQQQQQQRPENRANERSSLLGSNNNRNYDEYGGGGWNGNGSGNERTSNPSYYKTPPRRKKNTQETKSTKRKKSKRRRRTEKEKLRNLHSTDSSEEDEKQLRRSTRGSRRKKRHGGGRKRREDDVSDTMSETYSESFMTASLTDRLKSAEASVNVCQRMMIRTKLLICNLPLSAAAISFSIVLLGIVWLRRAEEILTSCKEVYFHSSQCNFPEFPGCYFCDTFDPWYQVATKFHTICSYVGGVSVALYAAKAVLFGRVFIDEMSSPTTASPAGLIFMTMALAFTGKGAAGAVAVFVASFLHLALLLWFIYMSLAYQTMPDPSWFPNTIGIGLCAVKVWFYNPLCGHFLIAMALMLTFLYYPISLIRVALNEKMSSTICWMQMICPAISLYSLAIVMQPSFTEERPDISHFQTMQRSVYLPSMTCLFGLCVIGMISSLHGLAVRWKQIQKEEFTPAHASYSFPLLMHALAVQAYLSSLRFFSETGEVNPALKYALRIYWVVLATVGSFVAVVCVLMYLSFLPSWIDVNTCDELEPPAPNETSMFETVTWGESLIQPYVSPTILQSNEAGVLVMTHDYENNWDTLVRTKNVPAVGFEPMLRRRTFYRECEALKHLVGGQDVIHEGDEADDDFCFDDVNV